MGALKKISILVHAQHRITSWALGSSADLNGLGSVLKNLDHKVHYLTFSGHGSMPFQEEFGIAQFAKELENYVRWHELRNCPVFGYSMGGYVALVLASQQPGLLGKVITLGTKFNWTPGTIEREKSLCHVPTLRLKQAAFAELLNTMHTDWELLVEKTSDMIGAFSHFNFLNPTALAQITDPVLLCLAESDKMATREETEAVHHQLSSSNFQLIEGAKHQLQTLNMKHLGAIIHNFVLSS